MLIPIVPVPAFPNQGVSLLVNDGHIHLDKTCNFQWQILDQSGNGVSIPSRNSLTLAQYSGWGTDDSYAAQCVAVNVGLTPV